MKSTLYIIVFLSVLIVSCNKNVLDKVPLDSITDDVLWKDAALMDAFVAQIYSEMNFTDRDATKLVDGFGFDVDVLSDEAMPGWWWWGSSYSFKNGALKIQGGVLESWNYSTIRKQNEFIMRVPTSEETEEYKKKRIAEVRFLRAFSYFQLVKRYGGVPLITAVQTINTPPDSLYPKREKEASIYNFVLSELDAIVNDLPEAVGGSDLGRPTRYAATALKCRAALYAASIAKFGTVQLDGVVGIDPSRANYYYQTAYDAAKIIMKSGKFSLYNKTPSDKSANYRNLFLDKWNNEVIFAKDNNNVLFQAGGMGTAYDFFQTPRPNGWGGGGMVAPYLEMIEEYEYMDGTSGKLDRTAIQKGLHTTAELWGNKDPRFMATIYTQNTNWKGKLLDYHFGIIRTDGTVTVDQSYNGIPPIGLQADPTFGRTNGFGVLKYLDERHDNSVYGDSGPCFIVFRYGEILLNYAEAAFELAKEEEARDAVNMIRERAGITVLPNVTRERIRTERKIELAFEGHRYWDVRRWRTAVSDLSKSSSGLKYILDYVTGKYRLEIIEDVDGKVTVPAFYPRNYYLPMTISRTASNPNLVENPGYE